MVEYASSASESHKTLGSFHPPYHAHATFIHGRSLLLLFYMYSYFKSTHGIKYTQIFNLGGYEMILSTSYLAYILMAYGLTFLCLGVFLGMTFLQWRKSVRQLNNVSHEA